jgi:hypothetical protein
VKNGSQTCGLEVKNTFLHEMYDTYI